MMYYTGSFSEMVTSENEGASIYYADPNAYLEAQANLESD